MWYVRFLVISLFLISCGKDNSAKSLWSSEQINTEAGKCIASATNGSPTDADLKRKATTFCNCMFNSLSFRVDYSTFKANETKYSEELTKDGTEQKCTEEAKRSLLQ